jgi:hypothetical protein
VLDYDPYESPKMMKKLVHDLTLGVLEGRLAHRVASACRGLLRTWIDVDLHEKVPELERRVSELERAREVRVT